MTAFDDAAAVLHADPNLSSPALYRAGGTGSPVSIRVIWSEASQEDLFGQTGKVARDLAADVITADAPDIARGDTLQIGAAGGDSVDPADPLYQVISAEPMAQDITRTVRLRPAP